MAEKNNELEQLYKDYFHDVFLFIKSISKEEELAKDITSETFFKAMNNLSKFKGDCDVRVWLCQIAKNTYFSYLKKHKKEIPTDEILPQISLLNAETDILTTIQNKETAGKVHLYLHSLEEPYKEVFTLRVFAELSFKEIGKIFGKTENWACVTFHRGKAKLKDLLEKDGYI